MKLYFLCDNIKGFDVHIKSIDGRFRRDLYLPRGEHAAYMETMDDLSQGFVMSMSDHVKDPEEDIRVRTVVLEAINYDFTKDGLMKGKLGDRGRKGEEYRYSTLVDSLPEDADSIYIRFVKMGSRGECAPRVVAMKAFGTSKIVKCDPSHRFFSNGVEKRNDTSITRYDTENNHDRDVDSGELYGTDYEDYEPADVVNGYRLFRILFMLPCGIALLVLAFTGMTNGLDGDLTYGDSVLDNMMAFLFDGIGFIVVGFFGLHFCFRSFMTAEIFNEFMTSYKRVVTAGLISLLVTMSAIAGTAYFATEGGIFATGEEKESIRILENDIWDLMHEHIDEYGYDIWETDFPQTGKTLVFASIADHALTEEEANDDPEKNMICNMVFRARNSYFYTKIWANEEKLDDTINILLERFKKLNSLITDITGRKYKVKALKEYMEEHKKEIKYELDEYGGYEDEIDDGIEIYIEEDYTYIDEKDESVLIGYLVEISLSDRYDIERLKG